ncbi:TLE family member 2, transcriptional corepressor c [Sinocyclocheilus anshuiensis]|uniref:TLE family member 2, transcriptional corepressor c n=1 Tax=Sinocyclocheilus anshuiensis TaxID=1608454 RepID=UPI0007B9B479|nr:PREDICTED: transducin-like enhancer protein 4 [Sinocyclocheilus anshuiensis]
MTSRAMYPHGRPQAPLVSGHAGMKFTVLETLDHIKEEFQLFQAQYHSLKLECEKLASEKTEMHRHYIMYYEMSYGLNIEMQKQAEIVKRLSAICTQIIPLLSQEGQQQFQHLSHHAPGFPLTPHPSGLNLGAGASLMALPGAFPFPPHLAPKDDITHSEPLDSRDGAPNRSSSGSPVGHRSAGLRLGLPPPPPSSFSSSHADMDNKRGGPDQTSTGRTRRESGGKSEDALRRDGTKEKSASPAGVSPRSTEGNGLNSSPVLRKNPSREGSSSPQSQPHSPGLCRSPTQEKVRSPSPSASHDSLSPGSPAPLSSSARGPSPALKHFLTQLPPFLKINLRK